MMTDMVGTQFDAQRRLGVSGADTVAMFGIGPMGGAGILVAKGRGARVIAVDILESRLEQARGSVPTRRSTAARRIQSNDCAS